MIARRHLLVALSLLAMATRAWSADTETVKCSQTSPTVVDCRIDKPYVKGKTHTVPGVVFQPGDVVTVNAGGCVQTGGWGRTWKRYVDPRGDNADHLYHGLIALPGVTGRDPVRIKGIIARGPVQLPPTIDPKLAVLVIGYEDDDYGDNGYSGHDDGNPTQCQQGSGKDGGPAWLTLHIVHHGTVVTNPAPFDLVQRTFDASGIPLNPQWSFEQAHPGQHPDPAALCAGFPLQSSSTPEEPVVGLGNPPCTTQQPTVNAPVDFANYYLCKTHAAPGHLYGHLNWWTATFTGTIGWTDHRDWTQKGDDDYDMTLTPDTQTGMTTDNPLAEHPAPGTAPQTIGLEFDSDETVDHIDRGWWDTFHKAVDNQNGDPGGPAGSMINGRRAIAIGLLGLDSEHGAYSELHPIYGLAIQVNDDPTDDQWSVLVRNWGDEGFCSQYQAQVPVETLAFFIPHPNATGATANTDEIYSNNDTTIAVETRPGGAVVTFELGPPDQGTLIHGLLHFSWTVSAEGHLAAAGPGGHLLAIPATAVAPAHGGARPPPGGLTRSEAEGSEHAFGELFRQLPASKQAEVRSKAVEPPRVYYTRRVRRVAPAAAPHPQSVRIVRAKYVKDQQKLSKDKRNQRLLCEAHGGRLPGLPADLCGATQ